MAIDEKQVNRIMQGLNCSREQALEIYATDKEIDQGKPHDFDLPPEKEKYGKKLCNTTTRARKAPTTYQFSQRERKSNATKATIIAELAQFLQDSELNVADLAIANAERQITFSVGDKKFDLTLIQKRTKKEGTV